MKKKDQELIYDAVGKALTEYMKEKKIKPSAVARISGEQFNTISGILNGKVCSLHHIVWMSKLGINVSEIVLKAMSGSDENEKDKDIEGCDLI